MKSLFFAIALAASTATAGTLTVIYTDDQGRSATNSWENVNEAKLAASIAEHDGSGSLRGKAARISLDNIRDYWRTSFRNMAKASMIQAAEAEAGDK